MTIEELIQQSAAKLDAAGVDSPRHDAQILVAHGLGWQAIDLITRAHDDVDRAQRTAVGAGVTRRAAREPLQHILGEVEFYGLKFACDARALVPRPDSEVLVDAVLAHLPPEFAGVVADFGTGSGCLLAAILANRPNARGVAIDISRDALDLAEVNFARHGLTARVEVFHGAWAGFDAMDGVDVLVSNPPYIVDSELDRLAPEVKTFDPAVALKGGYNGLDVLRQLLVHAGALKAGVPAFFEVGAGQAEEVARLLGIRGFGDVRFHQDLGGHDRVVSCVRG